MKTSSFIVAGLAVLALAACGSPDAQAPTAGGAAQSSLEPIDAVPLPLDDSSPLDTPPIAEPAAKPAVKIDAEKIETEDAAAKPDDATAATAETGVKPPRIVVTPRAPAALTPAKPAPTPAPAEPERPVLNF